MKHLSDIRLQELAEKVNQELEFTPQDQRDMLHIGVCEECYRMLRTMMAIMDVADHAGAVLAVQRKISVRSSAVISVVIMNMAAMMEQLQASRAGWTFSPQLLAETRSVEGETVQVTKLEDERNSKTFVAYDPLDKVLFVQLDAREVSEEPRAVLKYSDGTIREIPLEKRGNVYWGEVSNLSEGKYEVILEA